MKPIILAALLALPGLASASLGPVLTQAQTAQSQSHVVDLAWHAPGDATSSTCTKPDPVQADVVFACVVFPANQ